MDWIFNVQDVCWWFWLLFSSLRAHTANQGVEIKVNQLHRRRETWLDHWDSYASPLRVSSNLGHPQLTENHSKCRSRNRFNICQWFHMSGSVPINNQSLVDRGSIPSPNCSGSINLSFLLSVGLWKLKHTASVFINKVGLWNEPFEYETVVTRRIPQVRVSIILFPIPTNDDIGPISSDQDYTMNNRMILLTWDQCVVNISCCWRRTSTTAVWTRLKAIPNVSTTKKLMWRSR